MIECAGITAHASGSPTAPAEFRRWPPFTVPCHMSTSLVVGLLTFLLGLLLGHRMTLWREHRKEFNEVAARIRVALKSRRSEPRPYVGTACKIDAADLERFERLLGGGKRAKFRRAWTNYQAERERTEQDSYGQAFYQNPEVVAASLDQLIPFTSLR